jgi:hypothetical protein
MSLRYLDKYWDFSHYPQGELDLRYEGKKFKYHQTLDRRTGYLPVNYLPFVGKNILLAAYLVGF